MNNPDNLFTPPQLTPEAEQFQTLLESAGVRIERILSTGQTTAPGEWYDQEGDEWVTLLQGEAVLSFADGTRLRLAAGDYLSIPARQRHRVEYTSDEPPCIWLAVHIPRPAAPSPDSAATSNPHPEDE